MNVLLHYQIFSGVITFLIHLLNRKRFLGSIKAVALLLLLITYFLIFPHVRKPIKSATMNLDSLSVAIVYNWRENKEVINLIKSYSECLEESFDEEFVSFNELLETNLASDIGTKQNSIELYLHRLITGIFFGDIYQMEKMTCTSTCHSLLPTQWRTLILETKSNLKGMKEHHGTKLAQSHTKHY